MDIEAIYRRKKMIADKYGKEIYESTEVFEDVVNYPLEDELRLYHLFSEIEEEEDVHKQDKLVAEFRHLYQSMKPVVKQTERIYLWDKNNMPGHTDYTDNSNYRYKHGPEFRPYMYEVLVDDDAEVKGAVVVVAGGDHGRCVISEGYQSCRDLNKLGYQCFLLLNRVYRSPWSDLESGSDVARAIQYIRHNAEKYRISKDTVAYVGFSNGGLTGDNCIRYFSNNHKVKEYFPDYVEDELDEYDGSPDAYCCIYGPRFQYDLTDHQKEIVVDYEDISYPPTFIAVGREDFAMGNIPYYVNDLYKNKVPFEIHTFAGVPHGIAGNSILNNGISKYDNFELWLPLADAFMQDVYRSRKKISE